MILFLYGEDSFRSREKLSQLREAYMAKHADATGLFVYDFSEAQPEETLKNLFSSLGESGLFASKKLVVAKHALLAPEGVRSRLVEYFETRLEMLERDIDTVLVMWEEGKPKKNEKLFKLLDSKVSKKQSFEPLQGTYLEQWVVRRVQMVVPGVSIGRQALSALLFETGSDLFRLDTELRKLANYREEGIIQAEDVKALVTSSSRGTIFEALEALAQGNRSGALQRFAGQLKQGRDAYYLLSMVAWQLRSLLKVSECVSEGMRVPAILAKELKMHPFVVQKLVRAAQVFPLERMRQGFSLLADLDRQSKTGQVDPKLALDLFVMKF